MKKAAALLALVVLAPGALARGQTVQADIARGAQAYAQSNVEAAKLIFASILTTKQQVTTEERVTAYTYLGGYWALSGKADSAASYFIAALDFDPFTTLDPRVFVSTDEQNAFNRAKINIFKIGVKPIQSFALDPNSPDPSARNYVFKLVSTHTSRLEVEIHRIAGDSSQGTEIVASIGRNDGAIDVPWNGLINTQRPDTGLYELRVTATDLIQTANAKVVERQRFRIDHAHAPLEDTLPAFPDLRTASTSTGGGMDTLTSRLSTAVPIQDGLKGLVVAGVAGALPFVALSQRQGMSQRALHLGLGIGLGVVSGGIAAWYGTTHRDDRAAVTENARRISARAKFNADVKARNAARIAKTILIIRPITGSVGG